METVHVLILDHDRESNVSGREAAIGLRSVSNAIRMVCLW